MRTLIIAIGMGCLLVSCTEPSARDRARAELSHRRAEWRSHGLHNYTFDFAVVCCINRPPSRIEVRADNVVKVTDIETGAQRDLAARPWPTIDSVFANATSALANRDNRVEISYDPRYDYPTRLSSFLMNVGDAGVVETAGDLVPLGP